MSGQRRPEILVVAGEPSGDRIAALAARALIARGAQPWGIGGSACREAGVALLADSAALAAMGLADVARRLGVTRQTVYRYFPNADALLIAYDLKQQIEAPAVPTASRTSRRKPRATAANPVATGRTDGESKGQRTAQQEGEAGGGQATGEKGFGQGLFPAPDPGHGRESQGAGIH